MTRLAMLPGEVASSFSPTQLVQLLAVQALIVLVLYATLSVPLVQVTVTVALVTNSGGSSTDGAVGFEVSIVIGVEDGSQLEALPAVSTLRAQA